MNQNQLIHEDSDNGLKKTISILAGQKKLTLIRKISNLNLNNKQHDANDFIDQPELDSEHYGCILNKFSMQIQLKQDNIIARS